MILQKSLLLLKSITMTGFDKELAVAIAMGKLEQDFNKLYHFTFKPMRDKHTLSTWLPKAYNLISVEQMSWISMQRLFDIFLDTGYLKFSLTNDDVRYFNIFKNHYKSQNYGIVKSFATIMHSNTMHKKETDGFLKNYIQENIEHSSKDEKQKLKAELILTGGKNGLKWILKNNPEYLENKNVKIILLDYVQRLPNSKIDATVRKIASAKSAHEQLEVKALLNDLNTT